MRRPRDGTTPAHEKFAVYFNMDNGTGQFRGVHLQGNRATTPIFEAWMTPFHDLDVRTISQFSNRGTDHLSFNEAGLPGFQFVQDRIEYRARTHTQRYDTSELDDRPRFHHGTLGRAMRLQPAAPASLPTIDPENT